MIKFIGYAPDQSALTPGVFTACSAVIPTIRGFKGAPAPGTSYIALSEAANGAYYFKYFDSTRAFIIGTGIKLYSDTLVSWGDISRTVGGAYNASATNRWCFAQFGTIALAVQKGDVLQFMDATLLFANVTGAPKAAIVETVGQFVFLFNTNEGTFGDCTNRWWCSEYGNYAGWTPSVATQCTTGLLVATPGPITAAKRFGEQIIVYKNRSMYRGVYTGGAAVWDFTEIPGDVGAVSVNSVVNVGTASDPRHIFIGDDDFYIYDGARPMPIGVGWVKDTVFGSEINRSSLHLCTAVNDRKKSLVYFYYPTNKCVVYNYLTKQWGRDDRTIECAAEYSDGSVTIINGSHAVYQLTGVSASSTITTGVMGDHTNITQVSRVKMEFLSNSTTAGTMANTYGTTPYSASTTGVTTSISSDRFDVLKSARWHKFVFTFTGDYEVAGMIVYAQDAGIN